MEFCIRWKAFFQKQHFWVFIILCSFHILIIVSLPGAVQIVLTKISFMSYNIVLWWQSVTVKIKIIQPLFFIKYNQLKVFDLCNVHIGIFMYTVITCYHMPLITYSKLIQTTMNMYASDLEYPNDKLEFGNKSTCYQWVKTWNNIPNYIKISRNLLFQKFL